MQPGEQQLTNYAVDSAGGVHADEMCVFGSIDILYASGCCERGRYGDKGGTSRTVVAADFGLSWWS